MTTVVLVRRPETSALGEAANQRGTAGAWRHESALVFNGVYTAREQRDAIARALQTRGLDALLA